MEEINLGDLFSYYLTKIHVILICLLLVVSAGTFYSVVVKKPLYQSNATVVLASKKTANTDYTQSDLVLNQNLTKTYTQIVKSRKVLSKVIKKENLKYSISDLSNMISVSSVDDTEIIKITVTSRSKKEAASIANTILPIFESEISSIFKFDNVCTLDNAVVSDNPSNINILKETVIYVLIGLVLGVGLVFVIYYFDNSIKSVDVIEEKYKLNVIGTIPLVNKEK